MCLFQVDSTFFEDVRNFFSSQDVKKELVDPYVIFSFAGKMVLTFETH